MMVIVFLLDVTVLLSTPHKICMYGGGGGSVGVSVVGIPVTIETIVLNKD